MSYYQVFADGVEIHDPAIRTKTLINPVCKPALEEAGSFDFIMDSSHVSYNALVPYGTDIEVWEDGWPIFYGRPLPPTMTLYNQKRYHCEGIVAYLNDIIIPPLSRMVDVEPEEGEEELSDGEEPAQKQRTLLASEYIDYVFECISSFQTNSSRVLTKGSINLEANPLLLYETTSYMTALEVLRQDILPYTGGYLYGRVTGGMKYIDIFPNYGSNNQPIKAGVNMLDFTASQQGFYTAVMATGGPEDGDYDNEIVKTETPVYMNSSIISQYGVICAYKDFKECTSLEALTSRCNTFLAAQQFSKRSFEVSALDLHITNEAYDMIRVGETVVFDSPANGINLVEMLVTALEIHVDTGEKTVTLGIEEKTRLTQNWGSQRKEKGTTYQFDSEPTESSPNILSSGTVYEALHDTDIEPIEGSDKLISSGAVYDAIQNAKDGWVHQIDGVTQETGTINFVTET